MNKLAILLGDADLAQALVEAGLSTPRQIKAVGKSKLEKALGKGKAAKVSRWLNKQ